MNKFSKSCFAGIVLIAMVASFCACGDRVADEVVFAVGGAPAELDVWERLVASFETQTGIAVRMIRRPADTSQQLQSLVISLKARMHDPDVFLMDVAWVGLFTASDWLSSLDGRIDPSPFFQRVIDTVDRKANRLIALPVYMDGGLLYYRKDLLTAYGIEAPPNTWHALQTTGQRIQASERRRDPNFYGFVWTGAQYEGLITAFMAFAGSKGGFIVKDGAIALDVPANVRALRFMRDLILRYRISPPNTFTGMKEEDVRIYFQQGDALYERNWPYAWSLHQSPGSPVRGKTGVAPLPAPEDGQGVSTLGGFHIGVSKYSDVKKKAVEFIRFVTSYDTQKTLALKLGWNPGRQDLYDDAEILKQSPHFKQLEKIFQRARPRPLIPFYPQVSAIAQRHLNRAIAGQVEPKDALAAADRDIEALLARYRTE